jgi:hypothetical protein
VRDDTCMGFTRAEQTFILVRAKNTMQVIL